MATNYTGDPTATQAPGSKPSPGRSPILSLPDDGDALNVASVLQAFKELADYSAFSMRGSVGGGTVAFFDDFLGTNLSTYQWLAPSNTNATVSIVDDVANGSFGALKLIAAGAGAYHSYISQNEIAAMNAAPTPFFQIGYRVRFDTYATWGNASYAQFGFESALGPEIDFKCTGPGGAKPKIYVSINGTAGPVHNTTVTPSSVAYQTIIATCVGTNLVVTIDGTAVYTNSSYTAPGVATPFIRANGSGTTDAVLFVDSVSYIIGRSA